MTIRSSRPPWRDLPVALVLGALALTAPCSAAESDQELFDGAVAAFAEERFDAAIDRFELLADRGLAHPDASYDRGLAYVRRGASRAARPGDLGRAAAAFSEALLLRPEDSRAELALDRVRAEIARRRARVKAHEVEQRPALGWAVVHLVEEDTWAILALVASLVAALGLAARFAFATPREKLAGVVAASVGGFVLAVTGSLAALARHDRLDTESAVVVVDEARLLDASGRTIAGPGSVVPEGAAVRVVGREGTLAHVEWGTLEGWVSLGQLRLLTRR